MSFFFFFVEVVIGFERTMYTVNESAMEVTIPVVLLEGELSSRSVPVNIFPIGGSANSRWIEKGKREKEGEMGKGSE